MATSLVNGYLNDQTILKICTIILYNLQLKQVSYTVLVWRDFFIQAVC